MERSREMPSLAAALAQSKLLVAVMAALLVITLASPVVIITQGDRAGKAGRHADLAAIQEEVAPKGGRILPVRWGNLGRRMLDDGVIAEDKLARPLFGLPELPPALRVYLSDSAPEQIELTQENAGFWLEMLWGLGLANRNALLEKGPMTEDTDRLASTAGYEGGVRKGMALYDKFTYITLSPEQQGLVEDIASRVYRPCCANPTSFPDCNHGMAALGLIELMVSQGAAREDIYQAVLALNSYWFTQTYQDIAYFYHSRGMDYTQVLASEILSRELSSGPAYQALHKELGHIPWPNSTGASGC